AALQGNLSQNARERVMADFRAGRVPILLATNVAARGLDVADVDTVINFELPESAEWFTHRVGRTGRMGRRGQAITLLSSEDAIKWRQFERHLGRTFQREPWGGDAARAPQRLAPQPVRREVAQPARRELAQPARREAAQPLRRDGVPFRAEGSRPDGTATRTETAPAPRRRGRKPWYRTARSRVA
ncbi:MAG TPA: helicase-related protein, partial [Chloroflexota bacterium]|nr:helicase-related protein [Chloroflexota bacterium]